jgi:hypothetical protein
VGSSFVVCHTDRLAWKRKNSFKHYYTRCFGRAEPEAFRVDPLSRLCELPLSSGTVVAEKVEVVVRGAS